MGHRRYRHRLAGTAARVLSVALGAITGCGGARPARLAQPTGHVQLSLEVAAGVELDVVTYQISGNAFTQNGSLNVASSTTITARIGNIPAGTGYSIALAAQAAGGIVCQGNAPFNVTASMTTSALVRLRCRLPPARTGGVLVTGSVNVCPRVDSISVEPAEAMVGHAVVVTATATDLDRLPGPVAYSWTTSSGTVVGPSSPLATFTCTTPGEVILRLVVDDGDCVDTAATTVTCTAAPPPMVKINEIESNQGTPGDWVELVNAGDAAADVSGWVFRDNDDTHLYRIPPATIIPAGGYLLLEEAAFGFGLGAADSARLFDASGVTVIDSYTWPAHATTTYGRCANASGDFATTAAPTKGGPNACVPSDDGATGGIGGFTGSGGGATTDAGTGAGGSTGGNGGFDAGMPDGGGAAGAGGAGAAGSAGSTGEGGAVSALPWPGASGVVTVDDPNTFGTNLSGLAYRAGNVAAPAALWAVQNNPSKLYQLAWNGTVWSPSSGGDWTTGKLLRYPSGAGNPDSEGVTIAEAQSPALYVSTERDNDTGTSSRLSVLRFDTSVAGAILTATHEWNLTSDLPAVAPNSGLEAVTWIPDDFLVGKGFVDEKTGQAYDPAIYPDHGAGIFFVGLEANGVIYAYALDHVGGGFQRLATIPSGQVGVMDLDFDRDVGYLWAQCDNTCGNRATVLDLVTDPGSSMRGHFQVRRAFSRPSGLADLNNEGIAVAPESECAGDLKAFFWSDDSQTDGHALRRGSIPCGAFL